jgi:hypothetical protein
MGRPIAHAATRRLNTKSLYVESVMDKVALGQVSSNSFRFSCQFLVNHLLHFSHIIRGWYSGPFMAKGLSPTPILKIK